MRKRKYRKRRKRGWGKPHIRKTTFILGGKKAIFNKKKVYFGEDRKKSRRGEGIFGKILSTALPLVGQIVKVFK